MPAGRDDITLPKLDHPIFLDDQEDTVTLSSTAGVMQGHGADPFASECDPRQLYLDEARELTLKKLVHLAPYSEMLWLEGVEGLGKTCLLRHLAERLAPNWRVAFIECNSLLDTESLLRKCMEAFELAVDRRLGGLEAYVGPLAHYLEALGRAERRAIVILDDADRLVPAAWDGVVQLLNDSRAALGLSLVLSGQTGFELWVNKDGPVGLRGQRPYSLALAPLDRNGVQAYLRHRLMVAGLGSAADLFDERAVNRIYRKSAGVPGAIQGLAKQVLDSAWHRGGGRFGARALFKWGGLAVIVVVLGGVILMRDQINRLVQPGAVATATAPHGGTIARPAQPVAPPPPAPVTEAPLPAPETTPPVAPAPPSAPAVTAAVPATPPAPVKAAPKTIGKAGSEVATVVAPPTSVTPQPAAAPAGGMAWLTAQNPRHFTLQIMALRDAGTVERFIAAHGIAANSATYRLTRQGNQLTVLVYGSFTSRVAAVTEAKRVAKEWKVNEPWIRSFASVNADAQVAPQ